MNIESTYTSPYKSEFRYHKNENNFIDDNKSKRDNVLKKVKYFCNNKIFRLMKLRGTILKTFSMKNL